MSDRILIIEDDPEIATFERTILEKAGYEVRVTTTGTAGLEAEPAFKPAVILLDVELHDISGLDVCTSLANSSDAFILMVSACSSDNLDASNEAHGTSWSRLQRTRSRALNNSG